MCGIAGIAFAEPSRRPDRAMLERMASVQRHRGPDSEGFHIAEGVGFGMRRLSIIDTETGNQPISNEDGSVIVICNGEIYNYLELRQRLLSAGHTFRTQSDVEVIAHLYEENPEEFLGELRGMFGLAVWDANRRRLLLARDRLGIKPLHYSITRDAIIFGSELKAILASGVISPSPDASAFHDLLTYGYVRSPRTMLTGVQRLLPGQRLLYNFGKVTTNVYWDVSFPHQLDYDRNRKPEQWAGELREKLEESVKLHLRSDVTVGTWLSAGIDSSAIAALMGRQLQQRIHSFTLGFENPAYNELAGNLLLDECPEYGLISHRTELQRRHSSLLRQAVWHREQPFGVGIDISQWLIAELAGKQVKVVLTGEGSDEALGGYHWYRALRMFAPLRKIPGPLRRLFSRILFATGQRPGAAQILAAPRGMNRQSYLAFTSNRPAPLDFTPPLVARDRLQAMQPDPEFISLPDAFHSWHPFAQLQYLDLKIRMPNLITARLDQFSMAHSLEARVPFLDHVFVEFCNSIPPEYKMRGLKEKHVLRIAMRDALPAKICQRRKRPLSAPTRDLVDAALPEHLEFLMSPSELRNRGWFDPDAVASLIARHQSGEADYSMPLLVVLTTQLWDDLFLKADPGSIREFQT